MTILKVGEIMAKIPVDKLRRVVGGALDGAIVVLWNECWNPWRDEDGFSCSIPGTEGTIYLGADRMEPMTPEESEAFLDRMRSALEAIR